MIVLKTFNTIAFDWSLDSALKIRYEINDIGHSGGVWSPN